MNELLAVSEEVREALDASRPVVALETTLVAHGFPAPDGVEVGLESEAAVREAGAVPATIGVLDRRINVGLGRDELERFTTDARKAGPRDLATCVVQGAVGATTVGGALTVARMVGIHFLGTGGIGGVHRGFPTPPDVSADLLALVQSPVLVACSGAKSLLDVPATMEYLETLGIPVLGLRTDTLPLFYSAEGGPPVPQRVEDSATAARVAEAHWRLGGCGLLLAQPPPESFDATDLIEEALAEAAREGRLRPGGDPVRARAPARAKRREDPRGEPGADRRQRAAGGRGRCSVRLAVSRYDDVRDLPLEIESYDLELLQLQARPDFLRKTTVVHLHGGGEEGIGEDVTYHAEQHDRTQERGPDLPLAGSWTLRTFSEHLAEQPLFDTEPEQHAYLDYRRWAYESAALDLALRQAGTSLGGALGRAARPVSFVVSMGIGSPPSTAPVA